MEADRKEGSPVLLLITLWCNELFATDAPRWCPMEQMGKIAYVIQFLFVAVLGQSFKLFVWFIGFL